MSDLTLIAGQWKCCFSPPLKSCSLSSQIIVVGRKIASSHWGKLSKAKHCTAHLWNSSFIYVMKRCFWVKASTDTKESYCESKVIEDLAPVLGPANGGLMGSRELQGGSMLIIRRPQVAKFIFIWAARRKSFPLRRNGDKKGDAIWNIYWQILNSILGTFCTNMI